MEIGMLWFDNDPKLDLVSKVHRAARYYIAKYGQEPNLCFVHPSMMSDAKAEAGCVDVESNGAMLPDHFWIGVHQPTISSP